MSNRRISCLCLALFSLLLTSQGRANTAIFRKDRQAEGAGRIRAAVMPARPREQLPSRPWRPAKKAVLSQERDTESEGRTGAPARPTGVLPLLLYAAPAPARTLDRARPHRSAIDQPLHLALHVLLL